MPSTVGRNDSSCTGATKPRQPLVDAELISALHVTRAAIEPFNPESLQRNRDLILNSPAEQPPDLTAGGRIVVDEVLAVGPDGSPDVPMTILRPSAGTRVSAAIYFTHGGGMVAGDRYLGLDMFVPYVVEFGVVVASVEYRLAPEHPDPAPVEDCYAGLKWFVANAKRFRVDDRRVAIVGVSAGGGLAAGTALMARDRGFPHLSHQVLMCPMLDDRMITASSHMLKGSSGLWTYEENLFGWTSLLGDRRGSADVSHFAAPSRAVDLSGLPRTYIDVGSADTFRDEAIDYASRLTEAGVIVDFHLWGGGYHGFEFTGGSAAITKASQATRDEFLRRALKF